MRKIISPGALAVALIMGAAVGGLYAYIGHALQKVLDVNTTLAQNNY